MGRMDMEETQKNKKEDEEDETGGKAQTSVVQT